LTPGSVIIIGAGPAGLTAAYELVKHGVPPLVLEQADKVGGLARTETYKGYRFDIGGHRFFTAVDEVRELWQEVLGEDFRQVSRLSRIFYNGRFFPYPLSIAVTLRNLGPLESFRILCSYLKVRLSPGGREESFEEWVTARFGRRLYRMFFKSYTEKVWGIPWSEIRADWAAQRIRDLSLVTVVAHALFGVRGVKTLIDAFHYPRLGPGQMWERFREAVEEGGGRIQLGTPIVAINRRGSRVVSATIGQGERIREVAADHVISSMPIGCLLKSLRPEAPAEVLWAADGLKYRDFIVVPLIINKADLFPDNWIYIHTPEVRVGRIQNFKNWSEDMVPDRSKTCLGMEYFCTRGDDLWRMGDAELIALATRELEALGLAAASDVEDGHVVRQPEAYPVYNTEYHRHLGVIREYLTGFENLQVIGRNGMHRYNNQDHSMLCGLYAARNLRGARHDLWEINTERSYHEEQRIARPTPSEADPGVDPRRRNLLMRRG